MPVKRKKVTIDHDELRGIATDAAKEALASWSVSPTMAATLHETVIRSLDKFGIDTSDPEATRRDFAHLRRWREVMDVVRSQGVGSFVKYLIAGLLSVIVLGVTTFFARH